MQRVIKFRAWNITEKRMLIGPPHNNINIQKWVVNHWKMNLDSNYVLMQFTGLTDKNGKDIFEGDIIGPGGYVVSWGVCSDEEFIGFPYPSSDSFVVGNIYENPELLK